MPYLSEVIVVQTLKNSRRDAWMVFPKMSHCDMSFIVSTKDNEGNARFSLLFNLIL